MPGLHFCTLKRRVEPDLHDLVLWTEYALTHGHDPGMSCQLNKTADRLRMHFYIPAARTAAHCASGTLDGLPECGHHVFPHLFDKFARERATVGNDAVSLQTLNVGINAAEQ